MKTLTQKLDPVVIDALKQAHCEGPRLHLKSQLPPKDYAKVKKIVELLGGKWARGEQCHIFPADCEQAIALAIMTGTVVDFKKTFQIFETPAPVAERIVELARLSPGQSILEPSAGRGALLRALEGVNRSDVHVCEMHEGNCEVLARDFGVTPLSRDFMTLSKRLLFDRIIMNPPFRNGQDIAHVRKAFDHLKLGGTLVALTYPGWTYRTESKYVAFRFWLEGQPHRQYEVPAGAFSESGTEIRTTILVIEKL